MRRLSIIGALAALALGAALTMAASPTPSQSPSPSPTPSPASGGGTTAPTTAPKQTDWSAAVDPLRAVTGSADIRELSDGSGLVTLKLHGLRRDIGWFVDIDGGTLAAPNERDEIAWKAGSDVIRTGSDTLTIRLSMAEMKAFLHDRATVGVLATVSDGSRQAAAVFRAG